MTARITDRDHGYRRVMATVGKTGRKSVIVGLFGEKGAAVHAGSPEGLTVAMIGMFHELGLGVPERSWLRAWVETDQAWIKSVLRAQAQRLLRGQVTEDQALEQAGLLFVGRVQERIANGIAPPNAQATIDRKGSSTPLIDSGQFRTSIEHEVRDVATEGGG